jgi:hypothetical protein
MTDTTTRTLRATDVMSHAEVWAELKMAMKEIERLRTRLAKIENAPVDPSNAVAMTLKSWATPRDGEPANG